MPGLTSARPPAPPPSVPRGQLEQEAPGLLQELSALTAPAERDLRVVRLPALHGPAGQPPGPWLGPGPFRSVWRAQLRAALSDTVHFRLTGRGRVLLRLHHQPVLEAGPGGFDLETPRPVTLHGGLNSFELDYTAPAEGEAFLRVGWRSETFPAEPVPATAFVHDAAAAGARQAVATRRGRALFGRHLCARCHQPDLPWNPGAMPELAARGPDLDGLNERLQAHWLLAYLADPRRDHPDGAMPRLLDADPDHAAQQQAADLAAFLLGGEAAPTPPASALPDASGVAEGDRLFAALGCVACHRLADQPTFAADSRLSLAHVPAKWQPAALMAHLRQPAAHHPWTRMPTYALSEAQARVLAARLLHQPSGPVASRAVARADTRSGDPERGRRTFEELGCAACHHRTGTTHRLVASTLAALDNADWQRGCLAEAGEARGRAPDFGLAPEDRAALRAFAATDWRTSLRRCAPEEFAERQIIALRCLACHGRDGQPEVWSRVEALDATPAAGTTSPESDTPPGSVSVHSGRPTLSFAGEKLHAEWMRRLLTGRLDYKPRPENRGFMPAFPAQGALLAEGLARQHGYGPERPPRPPADPALAALGERLTRVGEGFGCVSCHDLGPRPALAGPDTAAINLAYIADRLLPEYYRRYLQDPQKLVPGTMMPAFIGPDGRTALAEPFGGDAQRQFAAIWQFLLLLDPADARQPLPAGITTPPPLPAGDYE